LELQSKRQDGFASRLDGFHNEAVHVKGGFQAIVETVEGHVEKVETRLVSLEAAGAAQSEGLRERVVSGTESQTRIVIVSDRRR